jgi:hypothetical protein
MFVKILLALGAMVAAILVYAALKEPQAEVAREISILSTPEKLFPYLNNSQKANDWMPWKDSDPGVKILFSGPPEGIGSKSTWDSSGKMGTGSAEVIESIPNKLVKSKLEYTKPMVMSQIATMALTQTANGEVRVRWSVTGHNSFLFRLIGIFVSMDKMVGDEFEKGLLKLKKSAESGV